MVLGGGEFHLGWDELITLTPLVSAEWVSFRYIRPILDLVLRARIQR